MEIVTCPHCNTRVAPTRDGVCPSCRKLIPPAVSAQASACPSCGAALPASAVLCVACGYHLKLDMHLATAVQRHSLADDIPPEEHAKQQAPSDNPYASPVIAQRPQDARTIGSKLLDSDVKQAEAVAADGATWWWAIPLGVLCCAPLLYALLPWYGYRLFLWYRLNARFDELREPNSLSPHGALGIRFQDARIRLWVGVVVIAVFWLMSAAYFVMNMVILYDVLK